MTPPTGEGPPGDDAVVRCPWATTPAYVIYHDTEWGRELHGDDALFERICLEAFQAGLSWLTILRKRAAFRAAFADFVIDDVAEFDERDVTRLLGDEAIVRNRRKIDAAIHNARVAQQLPDGLDSMLWSLAPRGSRQRPVAASDIPSVTPASSAMATELKRCGFRFVGPTTCYALMQATGMVDDHLSSCYLARD